MNDIDDLTPEEELEQILAGYSEEETNQLLEDMAADSEEKLAEILAGYSEEKLNQLLEDMAATAGQ